MNYAYTEKALYIYQNNDLNLFQAFNPTTGESFEEKDKALEWLQEYVSSFYQSAPVEISVAIDYEGRDLSFDEDIKIASGEFFTILVDLESEEIELKNELTITINKDGELKKYTPKIKDGKATKNIIIEEPGRYNILIDGEYVVNNEGKVIMHERNAFSFEIV